MVMSLRSRSTLTLSTPSSEPTAPSRALTQCSQVTSGTERTSWAMTSLLLVQFSRHRIAGPALRGPGYITRSGRDQQADEELGADGGDHGDVEQAGRRLGGAGPHRRADHQGEDDRAGEQQPPPPPVSRGRESHQPGKPGPQQPAPGNDPRESRRSER